MKLQGGTVRWYRKGVSRRYRKGVSRWYSGPIFRKFFSEKGCLDGTTRFSKKIFLRVYGFLFVNLGLNFLLIFGGIFILCNNYLVYFELGGISSFSFNSHFNYGGTSPVVISSFT